MCVCMCMYMATLFTFACVYLCMYVCMLLFLINKPVFFIFNSVWRWILSVDDRWLTHKTPPVFHPTPSPLTLFGTPHDPPTYLFWRDFGWLYTWNACDSCSVIANENGTFDWSASTHIFRLTNQYCPTKQTSWILLGQWYQHVWLTG